MFLLKKDGTLYENILVRQSMMFGDGNCIPAAGDASEFPKTAKSFGFSLNDISAVTRGTHKPHVIMSRTCCHVYIKIVKSMKLLCHEDPCSKTNPYHSASL